MGVFPHVKLDLTIPIDLDEALRHMALTSGEAKRSIVRRAIAHELVAAGVLASDYRLEVTPTAGPLASGRTHVPKENA